MPRPARGRWSDLSKRTRRLFITAAVADAALRVAALRRRSLAVGATYCLEQAVSGRGSTCACTGRKPFGMPVSNHWLREFFRPIRHGCGTDAGVPGGCQCGGCQC